MQICTRNSFFFFFACPAHWEIRESQSFNNNCSLCQLKTDLQNLWICHFGGIQRGESVGELQCLSPQKKGTHSFPFSRLFQVWNIPSSCRDFRDSSEWLTRGPCEKNDKESFPSLFFFGSWDKPNSFFACSKKTSRDPENYWHCRNNGFCVVIVTKLKYWSQKKKSHHYYFFFHWIRSKQSPLFEKTKWERGRGIKWRGRNFWIKKKGRLSFQNENALLNVWWKRVTQQKKNLNILLKEIKKSSVHK